ncbi:MAG: hypothetical protein OEV40_26025, partial [Acidimicrobiia bacterium]|nr:hypothetical protein [Acidimicrobiia bacterium]
DPAGQVTLHPPATGLSLDGAELDEPTAVRVGQVIASMHDRFVLAPRRLSRRRGPGEADDPATPIPPATKGRGIDEEIVRWARDARDRDARLRRSELAGPAELHRRIERGDLFEASPDHPTFGVTALAVADVPYELPSETSRANRATQKELAALDVLPGVPIGIDFRHQSVAVVGPRPAGRAVATWLALSLATQSAPVHLGVDLRVRSNPSVWGCLDGLPHGLRPDAAPLRITVVDESRPIEIPERGAIVLLEPGAEAPDGVEVTLSIHPESATLVQTADGRPYEAVSPVGISAALGLEWSLVLAEHLDGAGSRR